MSYSEQASQEGCITFLSYLIEQHEAPFALGDGVNDLLRDLGPLSGEADHAVRRDEHPGLRPKQHEKNRQTAREVSETLTEANAGRWTTSRQTWASQVNRNADFDQEEK